VKSPPKLSRQITKYCFNKYAPTQLKELCEGVFDDYFAVNDQQDLDFKEFSNALQNLGMNMNMDQMRKMFTAISASDGDLVDPYIDRVNFCDFILGQYYNSPNLQHYQEQLLTVISPKFGDARTAAAAGNDMQDMAEMAAMQRHLNLMIESESLLSQNEAAFQEELLTRKTRHIYHDTFGFCDEGNAEHWDKFEVAYWVGNILGFTYCMKRFFDANVDGAMLLFDMDSKMLMQHLNLKQIHLNTFQRRLKSLKRNGVQQEQEMEDGDEQTTDVKETETETTEAEAGETESKQENEQPAAAAAAAAAEMMMNLTAERAYIAEIARLNKALIAVTEDKSNLAQKFSQQIIEYQQQVIGLKQELLVSQQQAQNNAILHTKEIENFKAKIVNLEQKHENLKRNHDVLQSELSSLEQTQSESVAHKNEHILQLEIDRLQSQLRTKENQILLLKSRLNRYKSMRAEIIEDYDGDQVPESKLELALNQQESVKRIMEPAQPAGTQISRATAAETDANKHLQVHQNPGRNLGRAPVVQPNRIGPIKHSI